jgi:hypothetical protein
LAQSPSANGEPIFTPSLRDGQRLVIPGDRGAFGEEVASRETRVPRKVKQSV